MFKFRKTIKVSCFVVALFSPTIAYDLSLAAITQEQGLPTGLSNQARTIAGSSSKILQNQAIAGANIPGQQLRENNTILIANSNVKNDQLKDNGTKLKLSQLISRSFFLIFFIPCGIFYPLFLFYRRLLGVEENDLAQSQLASNQPQFLESDYPPTLDVEAQEEPSSTIVSSATVSKLQIAFSPQALTLRQKLLQISSSVELNQGEDAVDLMCKTVLALVSHQDWTHVNYTSVALPLDEVKAEFDFISQTERIKCRHRKLSLVNRTSNRDRVQDSSYRYVVVTLILCTTHGSPLFGKIRTEQQLIEELAKLSQMERESLIKFELLWNPQLEGTYLNNDQLLTEYSDMIRLL